jgi:hypothetical protein
MVLFATVVPRYLQHCDIFQMLICYHYRAQYYTVLNICIVSWHLLLDHQIFYIFFRVFKKAKLSM